MAYVYIPIVQNELDTFRNVIWNHSRGRKQRNKQLPTGIPEFMFDHPEECNLPGEEFGADIPQEVFTRVAEVERVAEFLNEEFDYMDPDLRRFCEGALPDPAVHKAYDADRLYIRLRDDVRNLFVQNSNASASTNA